MGFRASKDNLPPKHRVRGLTAGCNSAAGSPSPLSHPEAPSQTPTLDRQGDVAHGRAQGVASEAGVAADVTVGSGGQEQRGIGQDAGAGTLQQRLPIPLPLHGGGGLPRHGTVQQHPLPSTHRQCLGCHRHRRGTWAGRRTQAVPSGTGAIPQGRSRGQPLKGGCKGGQHSLCRARVTTFAAVPASFSATHR